MSRLACPLRIPGSGLLALILSLWVSPDASSAQQTKYNEGEKVDVLVEGKWLPGIVTRPASNGWYVVNFQLENGNINANTVNESKLRPTSDASEGVYPDTMYFTDQPERQWREADGTVLLEQGVLISITGNRVMIQEQVNIGGRRSMRGRGTNMDNLSEEDRAYINSQTPVPASEVANLGMPGAGSGTAAASAVKIDPPQAIRFADKVISLDSKEWSFEPGAVKSVPDFAEASVGLSMPVESRGGRGFSDRGGGPPDMNLPGRFRPPVFPGDDEDEEEPEESPIEFNSPRLKQVSRTSDGKQVAVLYVDPFTDCSLVDSITLESDRHRTAEMKAIVLGLNADTRTVVRIAPNASLPNHRMGIDSYNTLEVISEKTGKYFYAPLGEFGFHDPDTALFVNDRIVLIPGERLTAIDLESGRAYRTESIFRMNAGTAVSPDGTHVAIGGLGGVLVFNVVRGKPVGVLKIGSEMSAFHPAFSPDGRQLAVASRTSPMIRIFDLATGNETASFPSGLSGAGSLTWPVERMLVVDEREIVDVKHRIPVWQLRLPGFHLFQHLGGDRFWYAFGNNGFVHALGLDDMIARMDAISIEDRTVLRAGDSVSIEIDPNGLDRKQAGEVRDQLTSAFESRDIAVTGNAPVKLRVSVDRLPSETLELDDRAFARSNPGEERTITVRLNPTRSRMEIVQNGRVVWTRERENRPYGSLRGEKNESAQMAANRLCRPSTGFFRLAFGDRLVLLSDDDIVLGRTRYTAEGPSEE